MGRALRASEAMTEWIEAESEKREIRRDTSPMCIVSHFWVR